MKALVPAMALAIALAGSPTVRADAGDATAAAQARCSGAHHAARAAARAEAGRAGVPTTPPPAPRPFRKARRSPTWCCSASSTSRPRARSASTQIQALQQKKANELNEKNKQLQGIQQKLEKEGSVMNASAQADLQKQAEKLQVDIQRFDAGRAAGNSGSAPTTCRRSSSRRSIRSSRRSDRRKGSHFIFNGPDSGLVWADSGLDISADVIKRLDASYKPAGQAWAASRSVDRAGLA